MKRTQQLWSGLACLGAILVAFGTISPGTALADPPENQEFTGAKRCASCHFDQYMSWRKTGHAKAFDVLTPKYQTDEKCVKCHVTGLGAASGFKDIKTTPALAGVTCEVCHGPGSEHERVSQPFAKVKKLTPEQDKLVRGTIWRIVPQNVCVECHITQGHKESPTPPELRPKK